MEKRKWLSLLLAVTMLFTSIPVGMFAEGEEPVVEETATVEEVTIEEPAPAPEVKEEPAPAPAPEKKEEPAPAPEKKEEPAPVVEEKEEPAPVVEEKEEPAPVVEEKEEPAPVVEEKEEPAPVVEEVKETEAPKVLRRKKTNTSYHLPKPYDEFLDAPSSASSSVNKTSAAVKGERVIEILKNFNIDAQLLNTYIGPSVTKFEIKPDSSVKINKIMKIYDLWTDTVPWYEDSDSWKERYYACYRDERSVDESMQYMMDNSKPYIDWLVPGLDCRPLAWNICGGADIAETYESMKNSLQAAIDEAMNK